MEALAQERARKGAEMREAIETARRKVAGGKAKTEAEIRALEAEEARLQRQREWEAGRNQEDAEKGAAEATAAPMQAAETMIQRETSPGGSCVDTLQRFFDGDPASRMKIDLDTKESPRSEGSSNVTRPRCKGKGKTCRKAHPGLRPLRHLQRWGWTRPPVSPTTLGLQGCSARSRCPRRRQHPSECGRRGSSIPLPQQREQPRPTSPRSGPIMGREEHRR